MDTPSFDQPAPKSNRNMIIGVIVAVVLCCCCLVTAVGGYYGYQGYLEMQRVKQDIENFEMPTDLPVNPLNPDFMTAMPELATAMPDLATAMPNFDTSGETPTGGLANDETRVFAWASVQLVALLSGCQTPTADGTSISVLEQPDANGNWLEEWNVNCGDGSFKPFKVKYTNENGLINVTVEMP